MTPILPFFANVYNIQRYSARNFKATILVRHCIQLKKANDTLIQITGL